MPPFYTIANLVSRLGPEFLLSILPSHLTPKNLAEQACGHGGVAGEGGGGLKVASSRGKPRLDFLSPSFPGVSRKRVGNGRNETTQGKAKQDKWTNKI